MVRSLIFIGLFVTGAAFAAIPAELKNLVGQFKATDATCRYETARVSFEDHPSFNRPLMVETKGPANNGAMQFQYFDVDHLNQIVKQSKNVENMKFRYQWKNNRLLSESKGCVSNWIFCGPWHTEMVVRVVDQNTIKISENDKEEGCTFTRTTSL